MPVLQSAALHSAWSLGRDVRVKLLAGMLVVFDHGAPANAWFTDREGEWLVAVQGGHQAQGDWPRFPPWRWVRTNGHYGYGCACMRVLTDPSGFSITKILTSSSRSLATCRKDTTLREPTPGQ